MGKRHGANATLIAQERRLKFDAAALIVADQLKYEHAHQDALIQACLTDPQGSKNEAKVNERQELFFIDQSIDNYQQLAGDLSVANNVFVLLSADPGPQQIADILTNYEKVDAIHIISEGDDGVIQLGATSLCLENIDRFELPLQVISYHLNIEADILFYGCHITAGGGLALVQQLATILDADLSIANDVQAKQLHQTRYSSQNCYL